MVVPEHMIESINALQQNMFINAPTISQTAALKCWDDDTIAELEQHVTKYRTSRILLLEELDKISGLTLSPADGGFYIYAHMGPDCVHLDGSGSGQFGAVEFCKSLLEDEKVAITPGIDFEDPSTDLGHRRFRISYAGGIDTAKEAMERLHRFWPVWLEKVKAAKAEN